MIKIRLYPLYFLKLKCFISFNKFILLSSVYIILFQINGYTQVVDNKWLINLTTTYGYFGSIDEIHSPFRYQGNNFGYLLSISKRSSSVIQHLNLRYGYYERKPSSVPTQEIYTIKSYDNNFTYVWNTDKSLLQKKTNLIQQDYDFLIQIFERFNQSFLLYAGSFELLNIIVIRQPNNVELISLSAGITVMTKFKISPRFSFMIKGNYAIASINIRKPYAGIDGQIQTHNSKYYLFDYINRHAHFDFLHEQPNFQLKSSLEYQINQHFSIVSNYKYYYQLLRYPKALRFVDRNFGIGLNYMF